MKKNLAQIPVSTVLTIAGVLIGFIFLSIALIGVMWGVIKEIGRLHWRLAKPWIRIRELKGRLTIPEFEQPDDKLKYA